MGLLGLQEHVLSRLVSKMLHLIVLQGESVSVTASAGVPVCPSQQFLFMGGLQAGVAGLVTGCVTVQLCSGQHRLIERRT